MLVFDKKGKPCDSVAAILKNQPRNSCGWIAEIWKLPLKRRKETSGLLKQQQQVREVSRL